MIKDNGLSIKSPEHFVTHIESEHDKTSLLISRAVTISNITEKNNQFFVISI